MHKPNRNIAIRMLLGQIAILKQRLLGFPNEKKKFLAKHGHLPNLQTPQTYSEKLLWKKIHDRNPLLPIAADKYKVRELITNILGSERASEILIPLLHVSAHPDDIPFSKLPSRYVAKANHGSGWNALVKDGSHPPEVIRELVREWLNTPYGSEKFEWAYQSIPRRVVFEEFLVDDSGKPPKDFKFFMFHGKCRMILVDSDRFDNHTRTLYYPTWEKIDATLKFPSGPAIPPPSNLSQMIQLAEELSQPFDFVRVDLYTLHEKIYFGELTHYPGAAMSPFSPSKFDAELGSYWTLKKNYWQHQ